MAQDLSGLYISQSFQNLVQRSASGAFNVLATATGTEFIPVSASYAISASVADTAESVVSASYALSASHAVQADNAASADTAISASYALSSSFALSASLAQRTVSSSHSDVNLQEVLQNGNSASIAINLTASLNTTASLTEHKNEFKVTAQDKDTDFDVASFKIRNNNSGKTQITGSVEITGSSLVDGASTVRLNSLGNNATFTIEDLANDSFSVGTKLFMTGSRVGIIETSKNLKFVAGDSTLMSAGDQFLFDKNNFQNGDFKITDDGSRSALYQHENLTETGSIRFANTTKDVGIAIKMDDNKMALQMYSGSAFAPIIQRLSGSKQINLYDSTSSTGSSAQVLTSNANGGIEWGVGASDPFPFTGSAQITGSLIITGSYNGGNFPNKNNINAAALNPFVHGDGHNITSTGEDLVILGGESNAINSGAGYSAIVGAAGSQMSNTDTSVIIGGYQNNLRGSRTYIIAGNDNQVTDSGATFSGIIGGQNHRISSAVTASAIIGGKSITATKNETVYMPGLEITKLGANITGSIIGSGNIRAGQSAGAFSSDSIELGSATVPVQYGNFIIHGSNTRDLGNKYNGFQIQAVGGNTIQFANSAFTGLGNDVHMFSMGANSVGRSDNIKLWSSGSGADLNLSTDVVIQSGNKLTMSGSIELASNTGSAGQVIGVDSSGKAKWQNNNNSFSWTGTSYTQATAPGCDYVFAVTDVIPGGTFGPGDILEVRSMDQKAGSSGTTYTLVAAVNTGSLSAGVPRPGAFRGFAQNQQSADGKIYYQKTIYIDTAGSSSLWTEGNSTETQNGVVGGDPITQYAPSQLNWANDVVVFYGACIDNAGTTLENFGGTIRKIN